MEKLTNKNKNKIENFVFYQLQTFLYLSLIPLFQHCFKKRHEKEKENRECWLRTHFHDKVHQSTTKEVNGSRKSGLLIIIASETPKDPNFVKRNEEI